MFEERQGAPRIYFPRKQGSRTPEQFRAAVLAVLQERWAHDAQEGSGYTPSMSATQEKSAKKTKACKRVPKRIILSPAVPSRHYEAIREAVEKVVAKREAASKGSF
ncbi:MAG TPA: hypothetical protein VJ725_33090 [Thermoanaerobaculia bacterium]|nr:hypothetical protein [Thermoanaerobaculia bacterium]